LGVAFLKDWAECRAMNTIKKAPADKQLRKSTPRRALFVATMIVVGTTSACAPRVDTRGNAVLMEDVAAVEPGVFTRDHVLSKLGSPSSTANFGDDVWYYISERTETLAFLAPKVIQRQVIAVVFDQHGVVKSVDVYDKENAENVEPVDRVTPTAGNSMGMIDQFLSNLGRFNKKK